MKKIVATVFILGSSLMLSACASDDAGYRDTQPPYASDRTAGASTEVVMEKAEPVRAERVFKKVQTK